MVDLDTVGRSMRMAAMLVASVVALAGIPARPAVAEPPPVDPAPVEPPPAEPALVESGATDAWRAIAELLEQGRFAEAESALREFRTSFPRDARAPVAEAMAVALHDALARPAEEVRVTGQAGRLEVVTFSTLWAAGTGALLGFEAINGLDGSGSDKVPLWTAVGGGGLGLGLSLALTSANPPTRSQSGLISAAGVWGYALGAELAFGSPISMCTDDGFWGRECEPSAHAARLVPVAVSTAAVVGGVLYGRANPDFPTGDIALVNASGAWGFATALAVMAIARADSPRRPADFMLVGTTVGLSTGLALTPHVALSRSRMWLINIGGALGTGVAAAVAATAEVDDERGWGIAVLAGEAVGLATGTLLTIGREHRRGRERDVSLTVAPSPVSDGRATGMGIALGGSW